MKKLLVAIIGIVAATLLSSNAFAFSGAHSNGVQIANQAVKVHYRCYRNCYTYRYAVRHVYYTYHYRTCCYRRCYCYRPCYYYRPCYNPCYSGGLFGWLF